jgi:ribosome-associated protein
VTPDEVADHILAASVWRYSRASGPGGQHRDKTETRAELIVASDALEGLPAQIASRLVTGLHLKRRPLRLASQADRSRERNRATVEANLRSRVAAAMVIRPTRRATKPSKSAVARRLDQKAQRSRVKTMRRRPEATE